MASKFTLPVLLASILLVMLNFCCPNNHHTLLTLHITPRFPTALEPGGPWSIRVDKPITVENYFKFMDSIVQKYDATTPYPLSEHLLVRANPWIIDTLKNTDYYLRKVKGQFVYNQKKLVVLHPGDSVIVPDTCLAKQLLNIFSITKIDINIPEFKLRILEDETVIHRFPIRVGRPEMKFLKMSNRITDLRTKTGNGYVVNHVRNPDYYNPVNGHQYFVTRRDDDKVTALPQIPFIETEINGMRNGQLLHPTTNPATLGKPYSNGCIGTKEADAWVIYYHAPIGTKITIRYDLQVVGPLGKTHVLNNIYKQSPTP